MTTSEIVDELRELIIMSSPDPELAVPVRECGIGEPLDSIVPFSSVIILGVIIAVEDRFEITITREDLVNSCSGGPTLSNIASMIVKLKSKLVANEN